MTQEQDAEQMLEFMVSLFLVGVLSAVANVITPLFEMSRLMLQFAFEPLFVTIETFGALSPVLLAPVMLATLTVVSKYLDAVERDPAYLPSRGPGLEAKSETKQTIDDAVERVREQYVAGDIDEVEMEQQLARAMDPEYHELRDHVEDVAGIGDDLSESIAIRFGSVDELREADPEELQRVNGIGEQRAEAIRERV